MLTGQRLKHSYQNNGNQSFSWVWKSIKVSAVLKKNSTLPYERYRGYQEKREDKEWESWSPRRTYCRWNTCQAIFRYGVQDKAYMRDEGSAVASWSVHTSPDRAVRVQTLAEDIALCSWARHFTLTVTLFIQVHKWVEANLMLWVTQRLSSPFRGE